MADGVTAEQMKAALAEVQLAMADQIQKNVQLATSALEEKFKAGWAEQQAQAGGAAQTACLLYTSPSPRDKRQSRMPSSA